MTNKTTVNCRVYDGKDNACLCFAVNNGESCSFCSASSVCMKANEVDAKCEVVAVERRGQAMMCGKQAYKVNMADSNLVKMPDALRPNHIGLPWKGQSITVDLDAVFSISKITVNLGNPDLGAVALKVLPESPMRESSTTCSDGYCEWVLKVPFAESVQFHSVVPNVDVELSRMGIYLNEYHPIDGGWGYTTDWSECSTSCGDGTQNRQRACISPEPSYGGLFCEGMNEPGALNISRSCHEAWDCGTDWRVVLIIGWWQIVLIIVYLSRKLHAYLQNKRKAREEEEKSRRMRFSSDFDLELEDETLDVGLRNHDYSGLDVDAVQLS